jgi:multiple sugar transport system substrate-binding protein
MAKKHRLERMKDSLPGEELLKRPVTRRGLLAGAGATSLGLLLAACGGEEEAAPPPPAEPAPAPPAETGPAETGVAPPAEVAPLHGGLAEGMYGGPYGFDGAEAYQYVADSSEGRAIQALRQLVQDGAIPDTIVVQPSVGALGHWNAGFPEGAPSTIALLEEETGIKIQLIENVENVQLFQKGLQESQTRTGSPHIMEFWIEHKGDMAEAGVMAPLDDFIAKYNPDWADPNADPAIRFFGGDVEWNLVGKHNGVAVLLPFDGDYMVWCYRSDLSTDPKEQEAFAAKYGYDMPEFPLTWEQQADMAEFFTRPDLPMYGSVDQKNPLWGYANWLKRLVCNANPNNPYFNQDGSANVNNEAGWLATEEHVKSLAWTFDGALTKSWPESYAAMGAGQAFMAAGFPNFTKFIRPDIDAFPPAEVGPFLKEEVSPGRVVDGVLIRRTTLFAHTSYAVNGFADPAIQEAAYLILQWLGSAKMYTWTVGNPAGYFDPNRQFTLDDPGVRASYQPYEGQNTADILPTIAQHAITDISLAGANEYINALDIALQKAFTGQSTPEQAMKEVSDEWDKITDRIGADKQAAAIQAEVAAWPTLTDEPPAA